MVISFSVAVYNPLSLLSADRLTEIAARINVDFLLWEGTCVKEWQGRTYHMERVAQRRTAIHFG
eukprot:898647-Pyramimonas_sp.AAC.1